MGSPVGRIPLPLRRREAALILDRESAVSSHYKIMIMGASYGSLLAIKFLLAGHTVKLVCLLAEADVVNAVGMRGRIPVRGREGLVDLDPRPGPGELSAATPDAVDPADFDLVGLAMQEPQYRSPGVRELLEA